MTTTGASHALGSRRPRHGIVRNGAQLLRRYDPDNDLSTLRPSEHHSLFLPALRSAFGWLANNRLFPSSLFINKAGSVPAGDVRASSLQGAIEFAKAWNLAGIVMLSDPFVMCLRLLTYAKDSGLVVGLYENLNDEPECALIQAEAGLDAIIRNSGTVG